MSSIPSTITTRGVVGPQTNAPGITSAGFRQLYTGEAGVGDVHARYQEAAIGQNVFACVNSAAQVLSLTGTTTYTGMVVYNNPGSGKNLVILEAIYTPTTAETGVGSVILFSQAVSTSVPSLTATNVSGSPFCTLLAGALSTAARVASSCTLAANPIFMRPLFSMQFGTAVGLNSLPGYKDEIAGSIIVPPGAAIGFVAVTTVITGIGYISWEEVPIANVG